MSDFIEQCRREWSRLGVPDSLADEMAADLASDLVEAEAEGLSVEEYLGRSAADPRTFAASWASARGVVAETPDAQRARRKPATLVAFTGLAAFALIVAALLLATGEPKVSLRTSGVTAFARHPSPPRAHYLAPPHEVQASAATPIEWMLLVLAAAALAFTAWLWLRWNRARPPAVPA